MSHRQHERTVAGSDSTEHPRGLGRVAPGLAMLRGHRSEWLRYDVVAGLSVAAVALPVAIAYAQPPAFHRRWCVRVDPAACRVQRCRNVASTDRQPGRRHVRDGRRDRSRLWRRLDQVIPVK